MHKFLVIMLSACMSLSAIAQEEKQTPLEKYEGLVAFGILSCGLSFSLGQSLAKNESLGLSASGESAKMADHNKCIRDSKADIKKAYGLALGSVKKPAAKSALKEHYIAALNAIQGINPQTGEIKLAYDARQSANKAAVDKAWTRFDVEN